MATRVEKIAENLYVASATELQSRGGAQWVSPTPLDGRTMAGELMKRGWHVQDICDAIAEADPQWTEKLNT